MSNQMTITMTSNTKSQTKYKIKYLQGIICTREGWREIQEDETASILYEKNENQ